MKRLMTLLLAAGMLFGAATGASAIDFKAKGQWLMGFGYGDGHLIDSMRIADGPNTKTNAEDKFKAMQRVRLQLEAAASEYVSGTVYFEIGDTTWGKAGEDGRSGGALGADSTNIIKLKNAYLDWTVPTTDARVRMGIQGVALPNKAGGSAVLDDDIAGVVASYKFNDNVSLTALWLRPVNDNYDKDYATKSSQISYLDNIDIFGLAIPITFDGFSVTPWAAFGQMGRNAFANYRDDYSYTWNNYITSTYANAVNKVYGTNFDGTSSVSPTGKAYGNIFFAGIPIAITAFDPLNIEFDANYGYGESMGYFPAFRDLDNLSIATVRKGSTQRQGWLAKALVEYKTDFGTPGIFGWYASGDDGNVKNGSERMPAISPCGNFTSFLGDGPMGWAPSYLFYDRSLSYAGTWGIGARLKDFSFVEDLKHSITVAYWGGTNSPSMVKYMATSTDWELGADGTYGGPYLTTNDGLLEINFINNYQMYENLEMVLELGYIANLVDNGTWNQTNTHKAVTYKKQDAYKAQVVFAYTF
ncbi:MAG: outer membrane homotrimeric porin [Desulfovibrio sp.]|jgi:hypothetical protein|nr:outer membrane homotrimeric porin [Desulfovibrio sp.]